MNLQEAHIHSSLEAGGPPTLDLVATLYLPDGPADGAKAPGLIVGHGAGSRRDSHAEFCEVACSEGFVVLGLDSRGHGDSSGLADGPLELDLQAAASFLRDHPAVDGDRICYRGSSMGGFYGLKAAPGAGFAALTLVCPADQNTLLAAIDRYSGPEKSAPSDPTPRWDIAAMRRYFERQDTRVLAGEVTCPVLLIHARGDETVPFEHSLALTEALPGDTTFFALAGGSHTSAQHDPRVHRQTVRWMMEQIA
jgi:dipeptidyl aminopeptidase/acylaminoacyl peptidase